MSEKRYGHPPEEWERMVVEGLQFLSDVARRKRLTTYTELCQVIRQRTAAEIDTGEYALNVLLGEVSECGMTRTGGALITSLETYLDDNRPGEGFFVLAQQRALLPSGPLTQDAKDAFWSRQVQAVYAAHQSPS